MWRTRHLPAVVFLWLIIAGCSGAQAPVSDIQLDGVAPEVAAAVRTAQTAVVEDARSAAKWLTLGMVCEANGLFADAGRGYEHATSLDDRNPRAWYRLAIARARGGRSEDALATLDRAIALDGSYAPAHWRRGLWLLDSAKDDDARAAFEKATTTDPSNPGGWVGLARVALHKREDAKAVEVLERYLAQHPGDRYALRLLGTAYQRLGRPDEADYALAVGSAGEPVWPDPWSDQLAEFRVGFAQALKSATAQVLNGQFDAAVPALEKLQRERPEDVSLMHQLGLTYVAVGRASDGVALLEQALNRDPDNLESHLRLASAYINMNDYTRALSHAERAVALSPELGRAHVAVGMALWRGGRALEALSAFERAVRYDPVALEPHLWMGSILLEAGRAGEAMSRFSYAAGRNPTLADAFIGIGLVHVQRREWDDADAALQRAERLGPDNPRIAPARARLEAARGGQP
ncbi:MAG: tetratricopeptide repeat protein [Acidobacteriota bacterium]|nr:tetratricopeptide repeat protein [Acidobacteriota bacterium]